MEKRFNGRALKRRRKSPVTELNITQKILVAIYGLENLIKMVPPLFSGLDNFMKGSGPPGCA
jgi:hypothetical protein